jgi:general secretion pathway protein C
MGLDGQLKRFFPLVVCALLAIVALLQANGVGKLVAATVASAPAVPPPDPDATGTPRREYKSGQAILKRNPFHPDNPYDPNRETAQGEDETPQPAGPTGSPSDEDPKCEFGRVLLIMAGDDATTSFATFEESGGKAVQRRLGDELSGHTVQAFAWDRVWLTGQSQRCQMKLGDPGKGGAARPAPTPEAKPGRPGRGQLSPELAGKIHKVSDTEYNVERSVVDEILENQAELMRSARIVPEKEGDKVVGIRLFGLRTGTLLHTLGFKNGDRVSSINGYEISDPQKALEAYGRLRHADQLKVVIDRRGTPTTMEFNIR